MSKSELRRPNWKSINEYTGIRRQKANQLPAVFYMIYFCLLISGTAELSSEAVPTIVTFGQNLPKSATSVLRARASSSTIKTFISILSHTCKPGLEEIINKVRK